jgi:hypothetical protein
MKRHTDLEEEHAVEPNPVTEHIESRGASAMKDDDDESEDDVTWEKGEVREVEGEVKVEEEVVPGQRNADRDGGCYRDLRLYWAAEECCGRRYREQ